MLNSNILKRCHAELVSASPFVKFFLFGFLISFIAEGIGIIPKQVIFSLFLLFAFCLSLIALRSKTSFVSNTWIFIGAFVYLLYLFYLSFFSLNVQVSFESTVFIAALFLVFIVVGNYWEKIEQPFLYSLLGLGIFFCIYSFFLPFVLQMNLFFFKPYDGYQYVYAMFGSNHLGEFLIFPMLISFSFYMQQKKNLFLYLFFFYFLFFLFSYSRAAYIGFFVGFLLLSIKFRKQLDAKVKRIIIGFLLGTFFFFLLISSQAMWNNVPFVSQIVQLNPKSIVETRESYVLQGLQGFLAHRFYGVGLGNFEYASRIFTEIPNGWTASSHNIFLDILTETGTISFIIFSIFAIMLLRTIRKYHGSICAVLLLSWLVVAQFDYIHQMYSYLLLFPLFLAGLLNSFRHPACPPLAGASEESRSFGLKPQGDIRYLHFIIMIALFVFLIIYITSSVFLQKGNYKLSRIIYPLQQPAYTNDLDKKEVLDRYVQLFSGEYTGWFLRAKEYEKKKMMFDAIGNYERSFWLDPFRDLSMAERIYDLKLEYEGTRLAKRFAHKLFQRLDSKTNERVLSYDQWVFINKFCQKTYNARCAYNFY